MFDPERCLARLHTSHQRLLDALTGPVALTDEMLRRPSRLPDWSVGHVLTHIARNADSVVRHLEGAARDEVVDQYPGGKPARAAEIEAGAGRGAAEQIADVRTSAAAVERVASTLPAVAWGRLTRSVSGELQPMSVVLVGRIREVEIHHVDLGLGYGPGDWPTEFVEETLAVELPRLTERVAPEALLAWLTGRGPAPTPPVWR